MKNKYFMPFFGLFFTLNGQSAPPSETYYQQNMQSNMSYSELPTGNYYKNNTRTGGWDDDSPDGSGVGENTGVAVNIDHESILLIFMMIIYFIMRVCRVQNRSD